MRFDRNIVERAHILDDVQVKPAALVGLKVQHVAHRAVRDGGAKHRNFVFVAPVVDRLFVVDFLAQPVDERRRSPRQLAVARVLLGEKKIFSQIKSSQVQVKLYPPFFLSSFLQSKATNAKHATKLDAMD